MKTNNHIFRVVMILAVLFVFFSWSAFVTAGSLAETTGSILYVKPDTVDGTCADWENACDLQTALGLADDGDEIWVAEGVHYPGSGSDPRTVTFQLESGVALYGGFAGTETLRDERDWVTYPAILSGDTDRDDILDDGNVYHVVSVSSASVDETAVLDGFTITGGNANGASDPDDAGGGMRVDYGSPTLKNLTFIGNSADDYGGGMVNAFSSPSLTNVVFSHNTAENGGGIYNWISTPTLLNVTFIGNLATIGGGMDNRGNSDATLTNVVFSGNSAIANGGGMHNDTSSPTLTNVTLSGNSAGSGGGIYNSLNSFPTLTNVIIWGNSPDQFYNDLFTLGDVTYSDIQGGYAGTGNINADPLFVDPDNGNLRLGHTSPAIDAGDNDALPAGVTTDLDGSPRKVDIDDVVDTGNGTPPIVDMGAYEVQEGADIIYVDRDASGPVHDGQSWESAFTGVQSGLAAAGEGNEIWVAKGTYYPGVIGNRNATFGLKSGVEIYGGFAGTETQRDERDWDAHLTVLSGDLDRDGILDDGNAYHVVTGSEVDEYTILDGFTITGGNANGDNMQYQNRGGGMFNHWDSDLTLANITFSANWADSGGGLFNDSSSPTLKDITFSGNSAINGGGMGNYQEGYRQTDTNSTANLDNIGENEIDDYDSNPILIDVFFIGNNSIDYGGGLANTFGNPMLTNVSFSGNSADYGGGVYNNTGSPTLTNITFSGNFANAAGGGMFNSSSSPTLTNVSFFGNSSEYNGGGIYNYDSSTKLTNTTFSANSAGWHGGGIFNNASNPTLTNVTFSGNSAGSGAGGGMINSFSSLTLTNAIVWGNTPDQIYNDPDSTADVSNSDIQGGYTGTGNIEADPLFVDPDNGNLHLQETSPAIDAGDNAAVPVEVTTDLDGNPRFVDIPAIPDTGNGDPPIVDMGAYEVQPELNSLYLPVIWK